MERWDDLRFLLAVKKAGTMSAAARLLGANVGTVSRRIERLGAQLGVQPFLKTPDGWHSNPALDGLIEAATDFENRITVEMHRQTQETAPAEFPMKLSCPPLVSSIFLFPGLARLRKTAPEILLTVTHGVFSTALGDNDLIVTSVLPERGRLLTRKVGSLRFGLFAPRNQQIPDAWVALLPDYDDSPPIRLGFDHFNTPPGLRVENFFFLAEAMANTGLAGPLPALLAERRGGLVALGDPEPGCTIDMYLCYHETRRGDPAIETLGDWIDTCFSEAGAVT